MERCLTTGDARRDFLATDNWVGVQKLSCRRFHELCTFYLRLTREGAAKVYGGEGLRVLRALCGGRNHKKEGAQLSLRLCFSVASALSEWQEFLEAEPYFFVGEEVQCRSAYIFGAFSRFKLDKQRAAAAPGAPDANVSAGAPAEAAVRAPAAVASPSTTASTASSKAVSSFQARHAAAAFLKKVAATSSSSPHRDVDLNTKQEVQGQQQASRRPFLSPPPRSVAPAPPNGCLQLPPPPPAWHAVCEFSPLTYESRSFLCVRQGQFFVDVRAAAAAEDDVDCQLLYVRRLGTQEEGWIPRTCVKMS